MAYLLDTNIFIQAKNEYYGFDVCPGFWAWLAQQNEAGKVFSIEPVQAELITGKDELADWAKAQGRKFFHPFDQEASLAMGEVSQWVQEEDYRDDAKREFLSVADPLLVAYAKAHDHTVVTHEVFNPNQPGRRKIKIPVVCHVFDVPHIRTFEMLRREGASFVLAGQSL
jgi:predicted nucleic acid-binding protein